MEFFFNKSGPMDVVIGRAARIRLCFPPSRLMEFAMPTLGALTPNTIKYLKDRLLRVPFEIEMNTDEG